ncbi:MAG: TGS domain-containing protein, partial [Bacteroidota bacterium]
MIKITLPDGNVKEFAKGTNGFAVAKSISEGLARESVGIIVNNEKYDLSRPINSDASVRILTFNDDLGKEVFWHSSAHLMAEAIEFLYPGVKFGIGPAIENGFYYDVDLPEGTVIALDDLSKIEEKMRQLVKASSDYNRMEISWEEAVEHFKKIGDEYKLELLDGLKEEEITFYKQGNFIDLCRGTHVPNTSMIKYIKLMSVAGAYWRGD